MHTRRIGYAATLVVGCVLGIIFEASTAETKYRVIHDTETVTKTKEVPTPTLPATCKVALDTAYTLTTEVDGIDAASTFLLDAYSDGRIAVATGDSSRMNELETKLRGQERKLLPYLESMSNNQAIFNEALGECKEETNQ